MGRTLNEMVDGLLAQKGAEAYDVLGKKMNKSPKTVRRWLKDGLPNIHAAFKLAKACGCDQEEALRLARESFPEGAKKAG